MLLEVNHLKIEFHDHEQPETVVDDVSFGLEEGEILGIVGESGSGKSMTAMAIAGLLPRHRQKQSGSILFDETDMANGSRAELRKIQGNEIGIIFQEPMTSLNPLKKIGWQVEESLRLHTDLNKKERKKLALQALADAELPNPEEVYHLYPHNLSGGMRQRVMIAAAIVCNPRLLIADKPTTALDVTIQAQIVKLLQRISKEHGMSVLFISHDLRVVYEMCDRILIMKDGAIQEEGTPEEVYFSPKSDYTKLLLDSAGLGDRYE